MIVLIGGGGFLGSHVRFLLRDRHDVKVAIVTRRPLAIPAAGTETWIGSASFETPAGDGVIEQAIAFVHLATASVPSTFAAEPWREVSDNVDPALKLLHRIARRNQNAKFVFVSSGGTVYGNVRSTGPVAETTPVAPISPYGLGKVMIEEAVRFTGRASGLPYAILRLANPVGIHARAGAQGLVTAALRAARDNVPLAIFGDGSHVRDYLDADDVAEAILAAAMDGACRASTWNVGSGAGRSNLDVIRFVGQIIGRKVPFKHVASRSIDVPAIVLDCAGILHALGWQPRRDLAKTIAAMWQARHAGAPGCPR